MSVPGHSVGLHDRHAERETNKKPIGPLFPEPFRPIRSIRIAVVSTACRTVHATTFRHTILLVHTHCGHTTLSSLPFLPSCLLLPSSLLALIQNPKRIALAYACSS